MIGAPRFIRLETTPPTARLVRRREETIYGEACPWCGKPARYRYGFEQVAKPGLIEWDENRYCGLKCRDEALT